MTDDEVRARVDVMIDRIRAVWGIFMIAGTVFVVMSGSSMWWMFAVLFVALVGFNLHVMVGGTLLVKEVLGNGGITNKVAEEVEILDTCQEIVGRYYEVDVPEWIDVKLHEITRRHVFKDFAPRMGEGFGLPTEGDYVLYKGAIFQPAQSE